jgi:hypothetical protein
MGCLGSPCRNPPFLEGRVPEEGGLRKTLSESVAVLRRINIARLWKKEGNLAGPAAVRR